MPKETSKAAAMDFEVLAVASRIHDIRTSDMNCTNDNPPLSPVHDSLNMIMNLGFPLGFNTKLSIPSSTTETEFDGAILQRTQTLNSEFKLSKERTATDKSVVVMPSTTTETDFNRMMFRRRRSSESEVAFSKEQIGIEEPVIEIKSYTTKPEPSKVISKTDQPSDELAPSEEKTNTANPVFKIPSYTTKYGLGGDEFDSLEDRTTTYRPGYKRRRKEGRKRAKKFKFLRLTRMPKIYRTTTTIPPSTTDIEDLIRLYFQN